GGDLDLLAEMELLLEAHATAGSFAAQPAINVLGRSEHSENASAAPGSVAPLSSFAAGERLGPYRVCRGSDRAGWAMCIGRLIRRSDERSRSKCCRPCSRPILIDWCQRQTESSSIGFPAVTITFQRGRRTANGSTSCHASSPRGEAPVVVTTNRNSLPWSMRINPCVSNAPFNRLTTISSPVQSALTERLPPMGTCSIVGPPPAFTRSLNLP